MTDNLADLVVGGARVAGSLDDPVVDAATAAGDGIRQRQQGRRMRIGRRGLAGRGEFLGIDPRPAAMSATRELDAAVSAVNAAAGAAPRWSTLAWAPGGEPARSSRTTGQPATAMVSAIAEEAIGLFSQGDRLRLRACLAPGCVLYFLKDHPRREWCSAACGNRARAARHYQRHRGTSTVG